MCGILAAVATDARRRLDRAAFERGVDALAHRGPDGRGVAVPGGHGSVLLGHRRLAIQDPTPAGAQPMATGDGRWSLTYNGEVYRHPHLRRQLEAAGVEYGSDCDTETVLHAWARWGRDALDLLGGIFAFALWDDREQRLVAARDAIGVKPLYWTHAPWGVAVASTPSALVTAELVRPGLDRVALREYLDHGVAPGAMSMFAGVHRVPPGHLLTWTRGDATPRVERWWSPPEAVRHHDPVVAAELVAGEVERAVGEQLLSDVPVSTLLSGGLDSSVVTAAAQEATGGDMHSITVGFEEDVSDERRYADVVVEHCGTVHHESVLTRPDALRLLDELPERFDEPFGMNAALPMLFVAERIREAGFPVVLSGDGADELFGGYNHHDELALKYARWGLRTGREVASWPRYLAVRAGKGPLDPLEGYRPHDGRVTPWLRPIVLADGFVEEVGVGDRARLDEAFDLDREPVDAARRLDLRTYLPDEILSKVDRATMAHGVEARVPFLDTGLVRTALSIDPALHRRGGERKRVLKDAARLRGWLPEDVLTERKKGFSLRVDEWLVTGDVRRRLVDDLVGGALVEHGVLRDHGLRRGLRPATGADVFSLWGAEQWARRWL